jgi:hypothetical protein
VPLRHFICIPYASHVYNRIMRFPKVVEVAFCVSATTVSADQVFGLSGIDNLFVLHFRSDHSRISEYKELLFPCQLPRFTGYSDDFSYRIYLGLRQIGSDFTRKLGRYGMKQGFSVRVSAAVTISHEVWAYILNLATFAFVNCCFKRWPGCNDVFPL